MLSAIMLDVIVVNVITLSVIMTNFIQQVLAPCKRVIITLQQFLIKKNFIKIFFIKIFQLLNVLFSND